MSKVKSLSKYLSLIITILLFFVIYAVGIFKYDSFSSLQVFLNLFIDNAHLIIMAIGITFVLLIGGIDISVGAVLALTCMVSADLLENRHMNPLLVIFLVLIMGSIFGFVQGFLIHYFNMQPFIVTLAGLFFARGLTAVVNIESIEIKNKFYVDVSNLKIPIINGYISVNVVIAIVVLIIAIFVAHYTKFGRAVYAIGGNEQSAVLMGLSVGRIKVLVYTLCGFCAALSGVVYSFYMKSGYTQHGIGMEMDAIASAVIGGTLLTGGVGYVFGSLFGVLIQGIIITIISFEGTLSSWWTRIVVAFLLCIFIILQKLLSTKRKIKKI
jgi:simple sugar transport system permease protein